MHHAPRTLASVVGIALALALLPPLARAGADPAPSPGAPPAKIDESLALQGIEGLYDTLKSLDAQRAPCVALIDTEDRSDLLTNLARPGALWKNRRLAARLTALAGANCFIFHYTQLRRDTFDARPQVKAIVLKTWKIPRVEAAREELYALIRETRRPFIGFCGGFHQIYFAHGGEGGPLRKLAPGERDANPSYYPGTYKEWGFQPVRILGRDPILDGFGDRMIVSEMHACQCTGLPPEFVNLASSDECAIQLIRHRDRPLYGTQFHPEVYDEEHLDGKLLLLNFFKLAGLNGLLSR